MRRFWELTLMVLLAISFAQVAWWLVDQANYTGRVKQTLTEHYAQDERAARRLLERGVEADEVGNMFPHVSVSEDGSAVSVAPEALAALSDERFHHMNRYGWEGTFFLVVLAGGMVVLWRTLGQESALRHQQENFLALVTHELKSPLASLKLSVDSLATREPDAEGRRRLVHRMESDLARWETTVSNILDTAVLEHGQRRLEREAVSLRVAATTAVAGLEAEAHAASVEIELDVGECSVDADPQAVTAVIRNLAHNALKSAAVNGGGHVWVRAARCGSSVTLEVSDDGIGFPPGESQLLFEKFYRPGDEMRPRFKGTGLGLYLVRRLVELGGGRVRAESAGPGRGATFRVVWPLASDEAGP